MYKESYFLLFASALIFPVALSAIAYPTTILPFVYNIEIANNNLANIFRAVMGFYLASSIFWIAGALNQALRLAALWSLFIFDIGIGTGRVLSIVLDGMPDSIFLIYLCLEIVGSAIAFWLIKGMQKTG